METLWEVRPSLRRFLVDALGRAAAGLARAGHRRDRAPFLAPSFPGMTSVGTTATADCRLLQVPPLGESVADEGDALTVGRWPEQGLLATRWPVLIFVLDGECDVRFGMTPEVRQHAPGVPHDIGQYVVTAGRGQFLLIPSHFPRPDGGGAHWERPEPQLAGSILMWLLFFPTGCFIHFCRTQGEDHTQTKSVYLPAAGTFRLVGDLQTEVLAGRQQWQLAVRSYLELILLQLKRDAGVAQFELGISRTNAGAAGDTAAAHRPAHLALQRACVFIEDHLGMALPVARIAAAAGVSPSGLNQLFRRELQTSVAQYVISRRVERAGTLLRETNLAVSLVAAQCGFPNQEHFSRTFRTATGLTPLSFRRRFQKLNG